MELFNNLIFGFSVAFSLQNLLYCFMGCLVGTLIGVLPGIGPMATIAMLMPLTFNVSPIPAMIMLSGIYYGAMYGGSTTSILVNLPGETASVVTCIDGYQMARQGRAGPARRLLGCWAAKSSVRLSLSRRSRRTSMPASSRCSALRRPSVSQHCPMCRSCPRWDFPA